MNNKNDFVEALFGVVFIILLVLFTNKAANIINPLNASPNYQGRYITTDKVAAIMDSTGDTVALIPLPDTTIKQGNTRAELTHFRCTLTTYNAGRRNQCGNIKCYTASGKFIDTTKADSYRYCSVSKDIRDKYNINMHDTLILEKYGCSQNGLAIVEDIMADSVYNKKTHKYRKLIGVIDLLSSVRNNGYWSNVNVYIKN